MIMPEHSPDDAEIPAPWQRESTLPSTRNAIAVLAVMAVVAGALITITVQVVARGLSAHAAPAPSGPLIQPAPGVADGLPRRYGQPADPGELAATAAFKQRFMAWAGGRTGAYPGGLYAEPGSIDIATSATGWIAYLGYDARSGLDAPAAAITGLLASLTGQAAASSPAPAGPGGGIARCVVATIGGTRAAVCAWAAGTAVAALMSPVRDTSVTELAALLPPMRSSLQS